MSDRKKVKNENLVGIIGIITVLLVLTELFVSLFITFNVKSIINLILIAIYTALIIFFTFIGGAYLGESMSNKKMKKAKRNKEKK